MLQLASIDKERFEQYRILTDTDLHIIFTFEGLLDIR
jgi:hypothetical protein